MLKPSIIEIIALSLGTLHFGIPLVYYWYAKTRWLKKPWNLKINEDYRPRVSIIIPTYNEAEHIARRLDNIYQQDYPRELVEIIIIDSASTDGTPEIVNKWSSEHTDMRLKIIREQFRRGKARALNEALKYVEGEVVVIADADALWSKDALSNTIRLFSDPSVGAVSCLKIPLDHGSIGVESSYRQYYNVLRIAESKAHSTPIFHGELAAFRRELLEKIGGFPIDIGADDSYTAIMTATTGYRAIVHENITCEEVIPSKTGYHSWRTRRAQHLVQSFIKSMKLVRKIKGAFKTVFTVEAYLHLLNPWLLMVSIIMLLISVVQGSIFALIFLALGTVLLLFRPFRTWIAMQLYLIIASLRNTYSRELIWNKQSKLSKAIDSVNIHGASIQERPHGRLD